MLNIIYFNNKSNASAKQSSLQPSRYDVHVIIPSPFEHSGFFPLDVDSGPTTLNSRRFMTSGDQRLSDLASCCTFLVPCFAPPAPSPGSGSPTPLTYP